MNIDAALASLEQRKASHSPASMVSSLLGDGIHPSSDESELSDMDEFPETDADVHHFAPIIEALQLPQPANADDSGVAEVLSTKSLLLEQSEKDLIQERRKRMEAEQRIAHFEHTISAKNAEIAEERNKRIAAETYYNTSGATLSTTNKELETRLEELTTMNQQLTDKNAQLEARLRELQSEGQVSAATAVPQVCLTIIDPCSETVPRWMLSWRSARRPRWRFGL